jgi:ribokinase
MSGRVIVVGSVNVDLVVQAARLPGPGETVTGGTFERHHGGKGGNQAVAAARLGRPTLFVAAVGDDPFADEARAVLAAEHIDISRLMEIPGAATGVAVILVDARGENLIGVASGANADLEPSMVAEAIGRLGPLDGDVVLACNEIPEATVREALRVGRAAGATTVLNPAPAAGLDAGTLALADVMTPNRSELATLAATVLGPEAADDAAADPVAVAGRLLLALPIPQGASSSSIVVTLGSQGARLVQRDEGSPGGWSVVDVPAPVVAVIDSTGAGDAFNGALAVSLAERRSLEEACRRAVAAGALATTRAGAREGMPPAAVLREFLGEPPPAPPVSREPGTAEPGTAEPGTVETGAAVEEAGADQAAVADAATDGPEASPATGIVASNAEPGTTPER